MEKEKGPLQRSFLCGREKIEEGEEKGRFLSSHGGEEAKTWQRRKVIRPLLYSVYRRNVTRICSKAENNTHSVVWSVRDREGESAGNNCVFCPVVLN